MVYKWCVVPQCTNTSIKTPEKVFVSVPINAKRRKMWLKLARRDPNSIKSHTNVYMCEDHFDLPNDMDNYMEYHVMGSVSQIRMKSGCIPTKFECHSDRGKTTSDTKGKYTRKKYKKVLIEDVEKNLEENLEYTEIETMVCRMCLTTNVRMHTITDTPLQETYERITNFLLKNDDGKPVTACYICHRVLQRIQDFTNKSIQADQVLRKVLGKKLQLTEENLRSFQKGLLRPSLLVSCTEHSGIGLPEEAKPGIPELEIEVAIKSEVHYIKKERDSDEDDADVSIDYPEDPIHNVLENPLDHSNPSKCLNPLNPTHPVQPQSVSDDRRWPQSLADSLKWPQTLADCLKEPQRLPHYRKGFSTAQMFPYSLPIECESGSPTSENLDKSHTTTPGESDSASKCSASDDNTVLKKWPRCRRRPRQPRAPKPNQKPKTYICPYCDKVLANGSYLTIHIRTHTGEKPYSCQYCNKKFANKSPLNEHIRRHTGEKPFKCHLCSKAFVGKTELIVHVRKHTGETPFACHHCGKSYRRKCTLNNHLISHEAIKPHICQYCKKTYSCKSYLQKHIRIHTGERPYVCHYCGKDFSAKSNLILHLRIHTGEKPYSCHLCRKSFSQKSSLKGHWRTHTGEKPYTCSYCSEGFFNKKQLIYHILKHRDGDTHVESAVSNVRGSALEEN